MEGIFVRRLGLAPLFGAVIGTTVALAPRPAPAAKERCPSGMSLVLDKYCIDKWEARTVEVLEGGATRAHSPFHSVGGLKVKAITKRHVIPQAYISRNEAEAACKLAHKRLCTDDEWLTACRGRDPTLYPYGPSRKDNYCADTNRVSPLGKIFGDLGSPDSYTFENMNDPRLDQVEGGIAPTGSFPHCRSSFHVYDMVGNVHEWTADPSGTFRGGYFLDTKINGEGCDYHTVAHDASYHDYSTGFRCCADPR
jgi:sulfatase modifying factor 1